MATKQATITHSTITDNLPTPSAGGHLRDLLVDCGILTPYDRYLDSFTAWVDTTFSKAALTKNPTDTNTVYRFATWNHLRKLRHRSEISPLKVSQTNNAKQEITVALNFTNFLHDRGSSLSSATQTDIDLWISTGTTTRSTARMFVVWAQNNHHMPTDLTFPRRRTRSTPTTSTDEQLKTLHRLLTAPQTPPWIQAATVLLLVCAQPVSRIAALRTADIRFSDQEATINLARSTVTIPSPLATPIQQLRDHRPNMNTAANPNSPWLFPGRQAGQHPHPKTLMDALRSQGINLRKARNAAMTELLTTLPPAILASEFGFHTTTTERHAQQIGTIWSNYPALRSE